MILASINTLSSGQYPKVNARLVRNLLLASGEYVRF